MDWPLDPTYDMTLADWAEVFPEGDAQAPGNLTGHGGRFGTRGPEQKSRDYYKGQGGELCFCRIRGCPYRPGRNQMANNDPDYMMDGEEIEVTTIHLGTMTFFLRENKRRVWPRRTICPIYLPKGIGVPQTAQAWGAARGKEVIRFIDAERVETQIRPQDVTFVMHPGEELFGLTREQFRALPGWRPLERREPHGTPLSQGQGSEAGSSGISVSQGCFAF